MKSSLVRSKSDMDAFISASYPTPRICYQAPFESNARLTRFLFLLDPLPSLKWIIKAMGSQIAFINHKNHLNKHGSLVIFYDLLDAQAAYDALLRQNLLCYHVDYDFLFGLIQNDPRLPYSWLLENRGWIQLESCIPLDYTQVMKMLIPFGNLQSLDSFDSLWYAEYYDLRDAESAVENLMSPFASHDEFVQVKFRRFEEMCNDLGATSSSAKKQDHGMEWIEKNNKESYSGFGGFQSLVEWKSPTFASVLVSPKVEYQSLASESIFEKDYFSFSKELKEPSWKVSLGQTPFASPRSIPEKAPSKVNNEKSNTITSTNTSTTTNVKRGNLENYLNYNEIINAQDKRTTFMIKNIPNKYSQEMLIDFLNETHKGTFDFLYLRMDFKNKCNVGYAFINFPDPKSALALADRIVGKKWPCFNSDKMAILTYANMQGIENLIEKFRNSCVMLESEAYRPKLFYTCGSMTGQEAPFPTPTTRVKAKVDVLYSRME